MRSLCAFVVLVWCLCGAFVLRSPCVSDAAGAGKGGGVQSAAMSDTYEQIITAIHAHWKAHGNAYPQAIQLTERSWRGLNTLRRLVNDSMAFTLQPGWEQSLHGVPIERSVDIDTVLDVDGRRLPLQPPPPQLQG